MTTLEKLAKLGYDTGIDVITKRAENAGLEARFPKWDKMFDIEEETEVYALREAWVKSAGAIVTEVLEGMLRSEAEGESTYALVHKRLVRMAATELGLKLKGTPKDD